MPSHIKYCFSCGEKIPKQTKRCRNCNIYQYSHVGSQLPSNPERIKEIVKFVESGQYTLQQVADKYNLSRERIRQIYKRETKKSTQNYRNQKKTKSLQEREEKRKIREQQVKFLCQGCKTPVFNIEGVRLKIFCSKCSQLNYEQREVGITVTCDGCGEKFHPYKGRRYINLKSHFHDQECYKNSEAFKIMIRQGNRAHTMKKKK